MNSVFWVFICLIGVLPHTPEYFTYMKAGVIMAGGSGAVSWGKKEKASILLNSKRQYVEWDTIVIQRKTFI